MSYSRFSNSIWYSYWACTDSEKKEDQIFKALGPNDFELSYTKCLEIMEMKTVPVGMDMELIRYIKEFIDDINEEFDERKCEVILSGENSLTNEVIKQSDLLVQVNGGKLFTTLKTVEECDILQDIINKRREHLLGNDLWEKVGHTGENSTITRHVSISIDYLLDLPKAGLAEITNVTSGSELELFRTSLMRKKERGHKLYPIGECDNFDPYKKGCCGHLNDTTPE